MSNSLFLEILSGGAMTPELVCLVLLGVYLSKEAKRRGLRRLDWFKLPPSMSLILAMFVYDVGVFMRSATIWIWRRIDGGAGSLDGPEGLSLVIGGALIVLGSLCKIRALTKPDHGDGPWLAASAASAFAIGLLLLFR
jgi:hypothetical protein